MKGHERKLTLKTPYNTLLSQVWALKKNSSQLEHQNIQLKSKIYFRSPAQQLSKPKSTKKNRQPRTAACNRRPIPQQLSQKLQNLQACNQLLKQKAIKLTEEHKLMQQSAATQGVLASKIRRVEARLAKCRRKLGMSKSNQGLNKPYQWTNKQNHKSHQQNTKKAQVANEQEQMASAIEKEQLKNTKIHERLAEYYYQIQRGLDAERQMGKEILQLIEEKNWVRKKLKEAREKKANEESRAKMLR